jgi:hypothetical protein
VLRSQFAYPSHDRVPVVKVVLLKVTQCKGIAEQPSSLSLLGMRVEGSSFASECRVRNVHYAVLCTFNPTSVRAHLHQTEQHWLSNIRDRDEDVVHHIDPGGCSLLAYMLELSAMNSSNIVAQSILHFPSQ